MINNKGGQWPPFSFFRSQAMRPRGGFPKVGEPDDIFVATVKTVGTRPTNVRAVEDGGISTLILGVTPFQILQLYEFTVAFLSRAG